MPYSKLWTAEKTCKLCGKKSKLISEAIGVCVDCLRSNPEALKIAMETHYSERKSGACHLSLQGHLEA